jgi:repressor LexA
VKKQLTQRQREVFQFIRACCLTRYPPTSQEIGKRFGFSQQSAVDHLRAIERKGYIQTKPNAPRSILILEDTRTECITFQLTPNIEIRRLSDFSGGDFIRVQPQNFGHSGDVVLLQNGDALILTRLFGNISETDTRSRVIGKVIGQTIDFQT